jgi:hypothetical protein
MLARWGRSIVFVVALAAVLRGGGLLFCERRSCREPERFARPFAANRLDAKPIRLARARCAA